MTTMDTPWNDQETVEIPTLVRMHTVVAAIKLPTGSGEHPHQWMVVCEDRRSSEPMYIVWHVGLAENRAVVASNGNYDLGYAPAIEKMIERYRELMAR